MDPDITNCEDGDIRLVGGATVLEGRVEVCLNNVWGAVCRGGFHQVEAQVVCDQIGFTQDGQGTCHAIACSDIYLLWSKLSSPHSDSTPVYYSYYGTSNKIVYVSGVNCLGSENRLTDCRVIRYSSPVSCGVGEEVGVQCVGR